MWKQSRSKNFSTLIAAGLVALMSAGCTEADYRGAVLAQDQSSDQTGSQIPNPCPYGFDPEGGCLSPEEPGDTGGGGEPVPTQPTTANLSGAKAVASGGSHTCVLMKTNTVKCFGDNTYGQLGNALAANPSPVAVDVSGLAGVSELVSGANHSCAISGGKVYCWGRNHKGQLGNDTTNSSSSPVEVIGLSSIGKITAGDDHTCAIDTTTTRKTYCWGSNEFGQLGINFSTASLPKPLATRLFRTSAGTIYYGDSISAGAKHTCLRTQNKLYCAGDNTYGQLGADIGTKSYPAVRTGSGIGDYGKYVTSVTAGTEHTCAMIEAEDLYCWGRNNLSQLAGATAATATLTPTRIFSALDGVVSASAGGNRVCSVLSDGLSCWGEVLGSSSIYSISLEFGVYYPSLLQTASTSGGSGGSNPQTVSGLGTPLTHYDLGQSHACAVVGETVKCWGQNAYYQLGNADAGSYSATPVYAQRPL